MDTEWSDGPNCFILLTQLQKASVAVICSAWSVIEWSFRMTTPLDRGCLEVSTAQMWALFSDPPVCTGANRKSEMLWYVVILGVGDPAVAFGIIWNSTDGFKKQIRDFVTSLLNHLKYSLKEQRPIQVLKQRQTGFCHSFFLSFTSPFVQWPRSAGCTCSPCHCPSP